MRESEIRKSILYPLLLDAGYGQDEILFDYPITTYKSGYNNGITLSPDIVIVENNKALLVIETKSPSNPGDLKNSIYKSLSYSESLNTPLFAVTDGYNFQLFSKEQGELFNTNSIDRDYKKLVKILSKENIKGYSNGSKQNSPSAIEIEFDEKWLSTINNEVFLFENINEVKNIGARVIGWLAEKVFEKYCLRNGIIPIKPVVDYSTDFIIGSEKIAIKAIIEIEGDIKRNRLNYNAHLNNINIVWIVINASQDDRELLGYSFKSASILGYIKGEMGTGNSILSINRQQLMPIENLMGRLKR